MSSWNRCDVLLDVNRISAGDATGPALSDVSAQLVPGQVEVIVGAAGSGTTLLSAIAGQLSLLAGTITFDGRDVSRLPAHRRAAAGIGFVPEGRRIFRERTVMENLLLGSFALALPRREQRVLCEEILALFPALQARLHDPAGDLSGGQQQMLAISQALAGQPRLLLIDDMSAGLAPSVATMLHESVRELSRKGMAVMLVGDRSSDLLALADHVTVLDASGARPGTSADPALSVG